MFAVTKAGEMLIAKTANIFSLELFFYDAKKEREKEVKKKKSL